jgi:rod shape determining protein RodA
MRHKPLYSKKRNRITNIRLDWLLLSGVLIISFLGLFVLYSAQQQIETFERQAIRLVFATGLMIVIAQVPPRFFKNAAPWLYSLTLFLLLIVLLIGHIGKGGQRWLDLWLFRFQPAELMKIALPLMLAQYFNYRALPPRLTSLFIPSLLILIPTFLIAKQPDLGTAILILSSGFFVIFFAGIRWRLLLILLIIIAFASPALWFCMHDYQKQRVLTLFNPERDPLGRGYHIIQSKIAIGSGGVFGKGWRNGSQSQLEFLPERTTDSIFAVFGEEFGLVGCLIMITTYLCIIARGLYISMHAQETFSRLTSGSLIMTLFIYVFVNMSMVTGLLPVVGIPLPLVSYGGTSLFTLMIGFGILMSIQTHRTLLRR